MLTSVAIILFGIVLFTSYNTNEPAFLVKGDKMLTKDMKVNIEMLKQNYTTIATTFYEGKSYQIENQATLRYAIYASYKDSLFYKFEFDNLHGEIKGEPINEIVIGKRGGAILLWYKPLKQSPQADGTILLPWNGFVAESTNAPVVKDKFTAFYGSG